MREWKNRLKGIWTVKIVAAILIAVLSFTVVTDYLSAPETYAETMEVLDEKKGDVVALAATIVTASTVISMIPDDVGTPVADQIMDLGDWLLLVLCVVYLEKYALTLLGAIVPGFLIPIGCVFYIVDVFTESQFAKVLWKKLAILSLVLLFTIPLGVKASEKIDETYQASIAVTAEKEDELVQIMEADVSAEEKGNLFEQMWEKITGGTEAKLEEGKEALNRFTERVAIMVVTSCLIPVAVLMFMFWISKSIIGVNVAMPKREQLPFGKRSRKDNEE